MWIKNNRNIKVVLILNSFINKEFKPLTKKAVYILIIINTIFIFVLFNNIIGLIPYIFTASRHISFSITLAFPLWLACFFFIWKKNTENTLIHLIPNNTPIFLIPFIVIIETIRNIIRPLTLSIRLRANIIAGHLLIVLIAQTLINSSMIPIIVFFILQTMLLTLELAISFIQAYVISILITIYAAESI